MTPPVACAPGSSAIAVVKVGGSLYDLPDLGPRLRRWLAANGLRTPLGEGRVVLVPGGGALADAIRRLDRCHRLGEETAHWLALRAVAINAHFLAALLPQSCVRGEVGALRRAWDNKLLPILDGHEFARHDDERPGRLPHCWAAASDALAARLAVVLLARHLVLLKSTSVPDGVNWTEAGRLGWIDEMFAEILRDAPADLHVRAVNLRTWSGGSAIHAT